MEAIKINVDINVSLSEKTLNTLAAIFAPKAEIVEMVKEKAKTTKATKKAEVKEEPKAEVKEEPKAEVKEEPKAEVKEEPKAEVKEEPKAEKKSGIQIDVLRSLLREKVQDHREEIKAKLTELGAPSVTRLDPSKYEALYRFLISLETLPF